PYLVEGRAPEAVIFPGTKEEVGAALVMAGEAGVPVTPWGAGTKMAIGSPPNPTRPLLGSGRAQPHPAHSAPTPSSPSWASVGSGPRSTPPRPAAPPWAACWPPTRRGRGGICTGPHAI